MISVDFSVDYGAIAVDDILDIDKYLMKKNNIVENIWVYQECFPQQWCFWLLCIKCKSIEICFSE